MRWRLVDRVDSIDPWKEIAGRKAVSLEEYSLLERFGAEGEIPATMLIGAFAELGRWLFMASSGFEGSALMDGIEGFAIERAPGRGETAMLTARVAGKTTGGLRLECTGECGGAKIAHGVISMSAAPLGEMQDAEDARIIWREIHGEA